MDDTATSHLKDSLPLASSRDGDRGDGWVEKELKKKKGFSFLFFLLEGHSRAVILNLPNAVTL